MTCICKPSWRRAAIGLILYMTALGMLAARCLQSLRRSSARRRGLPQALSVATLSLLAGQGVDALASPSYQFSEVSLLFWACLGLGLAAVNRRDAAEAAVALPPPLRRALRFCAAGMASVVLVAQVVPIGLLTPVEAYYKPFRLDIPERFHHAPAPASPSQSPGTMENYGLTATYSYAGASSTIDLFLERHRQL